MDRCNKKIQRSGIWCRSQDKEASMTRRKGKTSGKCQIFPQFLQYIVYVQEEKTTKKRSQLFSSSAQRKNLISRANPNTQAISNSKAKGGKKRNSWRIKAKGIINCFAIPPLDFQLPPYLHIHRSKRKVKKKRTQFSSKRTPKTTQCRPTRPLVPRAQARSFNKSPVSTVEDGRKDIQLSALASEPARMARSAEFHQRSSRGAKSNQAEECQSFKSLQGISFGLETRSV